MGIERVTQEEMQRAGEAGTSEGGRRKWKRCGRRDANYGRGMNKCGRSGKGTKTSVKKKRRERAIAEVLSESVDSAPEEKERCVLYAPRMRAKGTRR